MIGFETKIETNIRCLICISRREFIAFSYRRISSNLLPFYSNTRCKMFTFKKYTPGLLPIAKDSQDDDSSERDTMLEHEYQERNSRPRTRRILTSNVPWILTTIALAIYIFISRSSAHQCDAPWSPTDVGKLASSIRKMD
jgi:hypothetical protein